jgi:hypothetical protein
MISDADRINFLQNQSFTKWVGYDTHKYNQQTVWPVFGRADLRKQIDMAIESSKRSNG